MTCLLCSVSRWVSITHIHFQTDNNAHPWHRNQWSWEGTVPEICKRGVLPPELNLPLPFLTKTYIFCIFFPRMHYCTNTQTASCACPEQWFKESYHVNHSSAIIYNSNAVLSNQPICFSESWITISPLTPNIFPSWCTCTWMTFSSTHVHSALSCSYCSKGLCWFSSYQVTIIY